MKLIAIAILFTLATTATAFPVPKFEHQTPRPQFKAMTPTPHFEPIKTVVSVAVAPLQTAKAVVGALGRWETKCNGTSCQKAWVEGTEAPKPAKTNVRYLRRGLFR